MKLIKSIHLWLGLTCGLVASVSGITGALYVWQPEIVQFLNPELLTIQASTKVLETDILKTTQKVIAKQVNLKKVILPYREQQTLSIVYQNGHVAYYHPKTGEYLGRKSKSIQFFDDLLHIHRTLGIPKIGNYIVGTSTLLFLILLLSSGFILWWKRYAKNLQKGLLVKWTAKKKRLNYDIHKSIGVLFLVPLTIIAFTGSYFTYHTYYKKGISVFDTLKKEKVSTVFLNVEKALLKKDSMYFLRAIYFPNNINSTYKYRYVNNRELSSGLRKTKEITTNYDHKIISVSDYSTEVFSTKITAQMYPIHIGEIVGVLGRFITFVSGCIPVVLYVTGIRFYLFRKKCI
ncbi:putative iron-regulated membrane protein [Wenyingzhuangia heitensis]|uniref:Iron-regulated membrane protein n=1 Tax=Wenyingzhuangia heitensis TaxID=1487859 RepID=A0ABX0U8D0_9FLAO|nr:PepSY-associated TM helix domain-containing protein [Wenyingzhuangia heitensis]NIJ45008.1 putative iron-regulated membrane protein [Wenyingzhuangia heitensis]